METDTKKITLAMPGLYMYVLASARCTEEDLLDFVLDDVLAANYNPHGRAMVGLPCQHGAVSRSYAMWFYEKLNFSSVVRP